MRRFERGPPPELRRYLETHARRFAWLTSYLLELASRSRREEGAEFRRVLDVGPSFQTFLLRQLFKSAKVDTLGYHENPYFLEASQRHVDFDLNDSPYRDRWPALEGYDLVLLGETIEHLYVGPGAVLGCLGSALRPRGYLVVQTPNAVALHKRLGMLVGRSPVAPLPDDRPGQPHLHEYTFKELVAGGERAGLELIDVSAANYIGRTRAARLYGLLGHVLPRSLRDGLTVTFRTDLGETKRRISG